MKEEWRDIPTYEGRYQASTHGRIKSLARCFDTPVSQVCHPERILRQQLNYNGYLFVHLRRPGEHKKSFVHRLVAITFLANPENKEVVNHKDRDRTHNAVLNLEWATFSENTLHYQRMDREAAISDEVF